MSDDVAKVVFQVQLDLDAIESQSLEWWIAEIDVSLADPSKPTWSDVYAELARVIVGSEYYQRYCITAINHTYRHSKLLKSMEITATREVTSVPAPPVPRPPRARRKAPADG